MCFLQKWNPSNCLLVRNLQRQLEDGGGVEKKEQVLNKFSQCPEPKQQGSGYPVREGKRRGKLEILRPILRGAQSCQFCSYILTYSHLYSSLSPLHPSPHLQDHLLWSLPCVLGSGLVSSSQLQETEERHEQGCENHQHLPLLCGK